MKVKTTRIIRCKDCKFCTWHSSEEHTKLSFGCDENIIEEPRADDFCSLAVRRSPKESPRIVKWVYGEDGGIYEEEELRRLKAEGKI